MSLVDLIAQADEQGLAASGLACLDRCVPLLGGDDEVLRPLWASLAEGKEWGERVAKVRGELGGALPADDTAADGAGDEATVLARTMVAALPDELTARTAREWADICSVTALRVHRALDPADDGAEPEGATVEDRRQGRTDGMGHLMASELRRQIAVLELLAQHGKGGIRRTLEVSVEGRRVLQAVVSRRARGKV